MHHNWPFQRIPLSAWLERCLKGSSFEYLNQVSISSLWFHLVCSMYEVNQTVLWRRNLHFSQWILCFNPRILMKKPMNSDPRMNCYCYLLAQVQLREHDGLVFSLGHGHHGGRQPICWPGRSHQSHPQRVRHLEVEMFDVKTWCKLRDEIENDKKSWYIKHHKTVETQNSFLFFNFLHLLGFVSHQPLRWRYGFIKRFFCLSEKSDVVIIRFGS